MEKIFFHHSITSFYGLIEVSVSITNRPTTALSSLNRFFSRNCTQYIVLFRELSPHNSSFLGTISSQQFFFGNHILPTVLFRELFPRNSSFLGTVSTEQFFFGNCGITNSSLSRTVVALPISMITVLFYTDQFRSKNCLAQISSDQRTVWHRSVPIKELFRQISSDQRTVQTDQFRSKNCSDNSVPIKELFDMDQFRSKNCPDSSVPIKELVRQFRRSELIWNCRRSNHMW